MKDVLFTLAVLIIAAPALADDNFSLMTGFDYSSGKYGNAVSTTILYIPVTGKFEFDDLTLKLTVPYISITGPGGVIQGMGPMGPATGKTTRTTNSGLGDIIASAGYNTYSSDLFDLDIVGKIKFGTADANNGLGTGENDYSLQADGYYQLFKKTSLFVTVGRKVVGAPSGIAMSNVPYGTVGVDQKLNDITNAGLMIDVVKSSTATDNEQRDVMVYASQKISKKLKIQADVLKGYSRGSPDFGVGIMITGIF